MAAVTTSQAEVETPTSPRVAVSSLVDAVFKAGRTAVVGVVEIDRTLLGYAKDAVTSYIDLGKQTVQARNVKELLELHVARAHAGVETTAANMREIVELSRQTLQDSYAPVKEVVATYRASKAA